MRRIQNELKQSRFAPTLFLTPLIQRANHLENRSSESKDMESCERIKRQVALRVDWRVPSRYLLPIVVLFLLFLVSTGRAQAQANCNGVSDDPQGTVTWVPQWCQEFNTATGSPDTTVWSFDLGNGSFGNKEVETYCGPPGYSGNPSNCPTTFSTSTSNAYLDGNGHLVIRVINNSGTWFSARMKTQGLQNFQYGRIESSIQLPDTTNQGLWPAFWSLGSNIATVPWPACGEVDFMENWSPQVNNGPGPTGNKTTLHTTATAGNGTGALYSFPPGQQADTNYHTYGTIWSANMMQFYVDDPTKPFLIKTPSDLFSADTWPFNAQLFLILNVAVGGTLGGSTTNTPSPDQMLVDYVRQYQPSAAVSAPVMETPTAISVKAGAVTDNVSTFAPTLASGTGYVYFSCSTNAPKASCAITTSDPLNTYVVNSNAGGPERVTVTVMTTVNAATSSFIPTNLPFNPKMPICFLISFAGILGLMVMAHAQRSRRNPWLLNCAVIAGLLLMGAGTPSCGGGGNNAPTTTPGNNGTSPGTYSVTVYAFTESNASDGSNSHADASVAIPLTVN
jgi:beta-glucanase (GH16 family)